MSDKIKFNISEEDADYIDAAVIEYEQTGHTTKFCPRCGGKLLIDINGNSYMVVCSNHDFKVSSRGI
jgi:ssDNA-binding Zn-finger/Zn-ribbon topoisomerase 1